MKRPVNMTVVVDDANPQGYALKFPDGSLSVEYFYRQSDLDYSIETPYEKQAWRLMLIRKFQERYKAQYNGSLQLHRDGLAMIEKEIEHLTMVPAWLFTTKTNE